MQDSLLWSQWCPYCGGSLYRTAYCGPYGVLIIEVSLYRTAYCGLSGVLIIEVSLETLSVLSATTDNSLIRWSLVRSLCM